MYNEYETILKLIENKPKFSECKNECLRESFKKNRSHTLGTLSKKGEGVKHHEFSVPTSQSVWTPKIGLIEYLALI